jgi:hypothetical protein
MSALKKTKPQTTKSKKKNFSSFRYKEAFKQLNLTELISWTITADPTSPSDFFQTRLDRLQETFDLQSCEESKKLLIDAICEEAIHEFKQLKIWKGASIEGETACGVADYLVAQKKAYLEAPFLCIVAAKKDDFEQGTAQCLVEMQACQWENKQLGTTMDIYGIVSNGGTWQFFKLAVAGSAYQTPPYSINDIATVLGVLRYIFRQCQENIDKNIGDWSSLG